MLFPVVKNERLPMTLQQIPRRGCCCFREQRGRKNYLCPLYMRFGEKGRGQRQRAAIAGAAASHKEIILYDEPTSGLDYGHRKEAACCDYFLFMDKGNVTHSGGWTDAAIGFVGEYFKRIHPGEPDTATTF